MMKWRPWIMVIVVTLLLLVSSALLLRQPILEYVIKKAQEKFKERYNADLQVGESGFSGLKIFYLRNISLVPEGGDTLLTIANFEAKISFRNRIFNCVKITNCNKGFSINLLFHFFKIWN